MNSINNFNKLYIGNELYEYKLKYSKRKSLEIKIKTDGQIYVSAPFYMPFKDIDDMLKQKSEWISDKLHIINKKKDEEHGEIFNMDNILFGGQDISFHIKEDNVKRINLKFDGMNIEIIIPIGFEGNDRDTLIKESLKKFYKKNTTGYLNSRLDYYEKMVGVKCTGYRVKDQKTRWGSCSSKANLNFNFRLSMTPRFVFDYVIVHELCHMKEMNHSINFWKLVEKYYPDYKRAKIWLKDNSLRLMFI